MAARIGLLLGIWLAQALVVALLIPLVDAPLDFHDYVLCFLDGGYWTAIGVGAGVVTIAQACLLWPIRKPVNQGWGRPMWLSAAAVGLGAALLTGGLLASAFDIATLCDMPDLTFGHSDLVAWGVLCAALVSWLIWTPIIARFTRRGAPEALLSRVSARLLMGTVIELMAIVPLHAAARKKTSCFCDLGSFFGLVACTGTGWFALGPAVFLPLLVKRRRRWYAGRCDACGYDMSGCMKAERCPECGSGWKPSAG